MKCKLDKNYWRGYKGKKMQNYTVNKKNIINKKQGLILCMFLELVSLYIIFAYLFEQFEVNKYNIIIFILASALFSLGISLILKHGIRMYSAMLITFYGALAINSLNLSAYQLEKSASDLYFYFLGPILMIMIFYIFESNLPVYKSKTKINGIQIAPELAVKVLLSLYWIGNIYVLFELGARVFDLPSWMSGTGTKFKIGGISGLIDMLMWLLLMLFPEVRGRWKITIIFSAFLFWGVFNVSRGNMVVLFIYLLVYYARRKGKKLLSLKILSRFAAILALAGMGFAGFGNLRQMIRGWENVDNAIISLLGFRINNSILAWIYGYSIINFDVAKLEFFSASPNYNFNTILLPFMRYFRGSSFLEQYNTDLRVRGINGFNASTILGPLVNDLGYFYFIEMALYAVILGIFARGYMRRGIEGGYLLLITWSILMLYGNFFMLPNHFISALIGLFALTWVKHNKNC